MKLIGRILLAPSVFVGAILLTTFAFPVPVITGLLMICSCISLIAELGIYILRKVGVKLDIETHDPFFDVTKYRFLNHLLGVFFPITFTVLVTYNFVKNAELSCFVGEN